MFELLLFVVLIALPPLLAIGVLVIRLRQAMRRNASGSRTARAFAAVRGAVKWPVWPGLFAVAAGAALLTFGLQHLYLAIATNGPRWGFDVVLTTGVVSMFATVLCGVCAGLAAATVTRARGFWAGAIAGLLFLLAVGVGSAVVHLPLRAEYLAAPGRFPVVENLGEGDLLVPFTTFLLALIWALPWPVLAAGLASRTAAGDAEQGVSDIWRLLLDLATSDLPDSRAAWGAALRSELAAIDPRAERRRFALGGIWTALRSGLPRTAWLQAAGVAFVVAAGVFAASRWSLAHSRGGVFSFWMTIPTLLLIAVGIANAWRNRSFGAGLRAGAVCGMGALVAVLAVTIPEAVVWANRRAGYVTTGDAVPPTWQAAVMDVLRPEFIGSAIVFWIIGAASGAALGAAFSGRRRRHPGEVPTPAALP